MTSVKAPPPRNYAQETSDSLKAQIKLAPDLLKAEQQTRPGYTALDLESLDQMMYGTAGQRGLVSLYNDLVPEVSRIDQRAASDQRAADINDVRTLGPEFQAALKAASPEQYALLEELTRQAQSDLSAGTSLTPSMSREIQQYVRQGQAARGLTAGPAELFEEAFSQGQAGLQLQDSRRNFAGSVVDLNQRIQGDPILAILSRPSRSADVAGSWTGQGNSMASAIGPRLFNPESQYGADLNQGNYEGDLAARTATANSRAGLYGGALGALGLLGGAGIRKWG